MEFVITERRTHRLLLRIQHVLLDFLTTIITGQFLIEHAELVVTRTVARFLRRTRFRRRRKVFRATRCTHNTHVRVRVRVVPSASARCSAGVRCVRRVPGMVEFIGLRQQMYCICGLMYKQAASRGHAPTPITWFGLHLR